MFSLDCTAVFMGVVHKVYGDVNKHTQEEWNKSTIKIMQATLKDQQNMVSSDLRRFCLYRICQKFYHFFSLTNLHEYLWMQHSLSNVERFEYNQKMEKELQAVLEHTDLAKHLRGYDGFAFPSSNKKLADAVRATGICDGETAWEVEEKTVDEDKTERRVQELQRQVADLRDLVKYHAQCQAKELSVEYKATPADRHNLESCLGSGSASSS